MPARARGTRWTLTNKLTLVGIVVTLLLGLLGLWRHQTSTKRAGDGGSIVIRAGNVGPNGERGGDLNVRAGDGGPNGERGGDQNLRAGDGGGAR